MGKTYKHAVIGYGGMGSWHHGNIRDRIPQIECIGAYDIRPEALERAKANGLHAYESIDALLSDKSIDLVTVATPNNFHKPLVIAALEAGKNVVCEKPVALNAAELEEMIAASERTRKLFSVHQNRRWDRDYRIIKEAIDTGLIGRPYFIESRVQGSRGSMFGWRGYKVNGGGMVLDWGVHLIDQLMDMIREKVVAVNADLNYIFSGEVDDNVKLTLRFESGISAIVEFSTNCFINHPRWHVSGTAATAVVDDWSCKGRIVKLNTDAKMEWGEDIVYTEAGPTRTMAPRPKETLAELPLPEVHTDWSDYYKNIAAVLDGRCGEGPETELIVKPQQCLRVMRVIDAVFESDRIGHGLQVNI